LFKVDVLYRYILKLGQTSRSYAELYGRSDPNTLDLALTLQRLGVRAADLEEYAAHFEVPAVRPLPRYPAPAKDQLNFMKPGSREVLHRPMHIPDHLPPMYPEMEEDEDEEAVGGAAASAASLTEGAEEGGGAGGKTGQALLSTPGSGSGSRGGRKDTLGGDMSEDSCPLREISSVMMTSSGFLSPCREGKMADSKTPHIAPEPEEKQQRPPPPPLLPVSALAASGAVRQLEPGGKRSAEEAAAAAGGDKRAKVPSVPGDII
jgi:transcription initiation factor TFIID subunit 3